MQLLWLLPSVGFGVLLGFASGQWMMAGFAAVTVLLLAIGILARQNQISVREGDPINWGTSRVAIGNRRLSRFSVFWKPEHRSRLTADVLAQNQLRLAQLQAKARTTENLAVENLANGLNFFAGFSEAKDLVIDLVSQGPHAFIFGPTGSGKSQFLKLLLESLSQTYAKSQLQLVTIDFKGGATLSSFHAVASTTDLQADHQQIFDFIQDQLKVRELALQKANVSRIEDFAHLGRLLIAVDELAAVLQVRGAVETFEAVASRGRSLGVHLVATAQGTAGISRSLLINLGLRVAVGRVDPLELAQLGFKAIQLPALNLEGMLYGRLIGNQASCDFSFPITEKLSATISAGVQSNRIQLVS